MSEPPYVGDIRNTLCTLLKKSRFRIWVMLDRLDEVFPRNTDEETNGLKGLLKAVYNLSHDELRIKIFLRDDIVSQLASGGFTALTHVMDRASDPMRWDREKLLLLIVKRVFAHVQIASHFAVDIAKLDNDPAYRSECFYRVFPHKIGKLETFDWILNMLADGSNIVTPRDTIDLLNMAKGIEYKKFQHNKGNREHLLSVDSMREALEELSVQKRKNYLEAEFPHMWNNIEKLQDGHSIHNGQSLELLYGQDWKRVVDDFISIGLLKHDPKKAYYRVPKLYMKGLRITQGKSFAGQK